MTRLYAEADRWADHGKASGVWERDGTSQVGFSSERSGVAGVAEIVLFSPELHTPVWADQHRRKSSPEMERHAMNYRGIACNISGSLCMLQEHVCTSPDVDRDGTVRLGEGIRTKPTGSKVCGEHLGCGTHAVHPAPLGCGYWEFFRSQFNGVYGVVSFLT